MYFKSSTHRKLEKVSKSFIAFIFISTLSACSGLFFFPEREHLQTPKNLGLDFQDVSLTAADNTPLHAWFLPSIATPKGSILFLHGNAENISTHIHNVRWLPAAGYQVLLLDYRGFGQSSGQPKLPEVFLDIDAAVDWLSETPQTETQGVFILGQSLGASLMLHSATRHTKNSKLCGLVSDAAFTRYKDIIRHVAGQSWLIWPLQYPVSWSVGTHYDPINAVSYLDTLPILFFHSTDDQVIPFTNLDPLVAAHAGPHQRVVTQGRHTATFNLEENRSILLDFLSTHSCASKL